MCVLGHYKRYIAFIVILATLTISLLGCTPNVEEQPDFITNWCEERAAAINFKDTNAYLNTINNDNTFLYKEEYNLIDSLDLSYVSNFDLLATDLTEIDDTHMSATITQRYDSIEGPRECEYRARFIIKDDKVYYDGLDQIDLVDGLIYVSYPHHLKTFAVYISGIAKQYLIDAKEVYDYEPDRSLSFKVYHDHEVFLQSVKLDLPNWVGGWHEYGESVKIYTRSNSTHFYDTMVNHECTHRFLSDITGDNASYWLQEGLATLLQNEGAASIHDLTYRERDALLAMENRWDFETFIKVDLEALEDPTEVRAYYAMAAATTLYFIDILGVDGFLDTVKTLSDYPYIQCTAAEKMDTTTARTLEVLLKATDMNQEALYQAIDQWLDNEGYNK